MSNNCIKSIIIAGISIGLLGACSRLQPVYNVQEPLQTASSKSIASEKVGKIISHAAVQQGWKIKSTGVGKYKASIAWREHSAVADIEYSSNSYSINLASSENLLEGKGQIHRKYNQYVRSLKIQIDHDLAAAGIN